MTVRRGRLSVVAGLALLVMALGGLPAPATADKALDDALFDLQLVPLSGPAPAWSLQGLDGKRVTLAEHRGRPLLLYFWATW